MEASEGEGGREEERESEGGREEGVPSQFFSGEGSKLTVVEGGRVVALLSVEREESRRGGR
jgi:hypothetical protein